jgi:hypothetical protein
VVRTLLAGRGGRRSRQDDERDCVLLLFMIYPFTNKFSKHIFAFEESSEAKGVRKTKD